MKAQKIDKPKGKVYPAETAGQRIQSVDLLTKDMEAAARLNLSFTVTTIHRRAFHEYRIEFGELTEVE